MSRPLWISAIQEKNYVESYLKSYSETWFFLHTVTGFLERLYFCGFWYLYCDMGRVNGGNFVDTAQPMVENSICVQSIVLSTTKEWEKVLRAIKALENMAHGLGFSADLF